jgi:HEAT repeat protein
MALEDPHPNIRGYCSRVLGTFRDERVFPLLAEMVREEASPGPRHEALAALGRLGDPRGYEILLAKLSDPSDRAWAVKGLGLLGDARAFPRIEKLYRELSSDPWLSSMAPEALLSLDEERAVDFLLELFPRVESAPRSALARALGEHPGPKVREAVTALLASEDGGLRLSAVQVLAAAGDSGTVPLLVPLLSGHRRERGAAADALRRIGDPAAARPIAELLSREILPTHRVTFLRALAELGDRRAVASMVPLLEDEGKTPQPMTISSVWTFPYNLHVKAAALWALRTLIDTEPPFEAAKLSLFPMAERDEWAEEGIPAFLRWWEKHREDPAYRFE